MLKLFGGRKPGLVGLDISASAIKLLELSRDDGGYVVEGAGAIGGRHFCRGFFGDTPLAYSFFNRGSRIWLVVWVDVVGQLFSR